ncbi:GntR family transcriptional regulator [Methylorubrum sp. GM97]|uniref:GntR family transcriptional regulator n=1 Tax=Methylorubrum sp. GM97 TaxID=2938232 RepID=UPI0021C4B3E3|nr:FCD domain-containing protein [Methylorubrum sp. GM97]
MAEMADLERIAISPQLSEHTRSMTEAREAGDLAAWGRADDCFHRTLVERACNGRMIRINQTITDQAHRARMLTLKLRGELGASVAEHERIIEAIRMGDVAAAQEQAYRHRSRARDELLPLLDSFGLKHL